MTQEDLVYDKILDGGTLAKEVREDRGSIIDSNGKSYWPDTIDTTKNYRVKKYEYWRALQYYPVVSYKIEEIQS